MAIVSKGSGGSIKFTGTGGGISISSSGGGGGGGGGGSPPMTMLGAWFRADDAGTSNGSSVSSWADRSASGDVLTVASGRSAPVYLSSVGALNNQPVVDFSIGQGLEMLSPAAYLAGDAALTIYAVLELDSYATETRIFTYGTQGTYQQQSMVSLFLQNYYGSPRLGLQTGYAHAFYNADLTAKIVEIKIAQGATLGNVFQAVNGVTQSNDFFNQNTVRAIPSPVDSVTMGGTQNGAFDFDGRIAEVIYYKKEHDSSERAATLSYLSSRYGISV